MSRRVKLALGAALVALAISWIAQLVFRQMFVDALDSCLPFRESYAPTLSGMFIVYVLPLVAGYGLGAAFLSRQIRTAVYFVNISVFAGLLWVLPLLAVPVFVDGYWFSASSVAYYAMLVPVLLCTACAAHMVKVPRRVITLPMVRDDAGSLGVRGWAAGLLIATLVFVANCIPMLLSDYLVGADVYYHAAKSQTIADGESLGTNPFFVGERNYYSSVVYYVTSGVSKLTGLSLETVWMLYVPVCSFIFAAAFYVFLWNITRLRSAAIIGTILASLLNQVLWADPSARALSYAFFAIFLLAFSAFLRTKYWAYLAATSVAFLFTVASHPEIAIHIVLITAAYGLLSLRFCRAWMSKWLVKWIRKERYEGVYLHAFDGYYASLVLLAMLLLVLSRYILYSVQNYPITQILIFNEIPLSLFMPIGVSSLVVFLLGIAGLAQLVPLLAFPGGSGRPKPASGGPPPGQLYARYTSPGARPPATTLERPSGSQGRQEGALATRMPVESRARLIIAVASLSLFGVFYFSHLWVLYHRYFFETAYFAFVVVAACYMAVMYRQYKKWTVLIIAGFVVASVGPRAYFVMSYSRSTHIALSARQQDFDMIQAASAQDAVVMIKPTDMINRYLPFYGQRRIFAGSSLLTRDQQWQVLAFCNGPYSSACDRRDAISSGFYEAPSISGIRAIREKDRVDYVLFNVEDQAQFAAYKQSDFYERPPTARNSHYVVYDVRSL